MKDNPLFVSPKLGEKIRVTPFVSFSGWGRKCILSMMALARMDYAECEGSRTGRGVKDRPTVKKTNTIEGYAIKEEMDL